MSVTPPITPPVSHRAQKPWVAVDEFIQRTLISADEALAAALGDSAAAGLPDIQVMPAHGKLLHLLARLMHARRILELGTLGGYSTIWLARAVTPGGRVVTLELDPRHAAVARANFARAGLADVIDLREGRALDLLPRLAAQHPEPFDLSFIDADKESAPEYFDWAVRLSRRGGCVIVDNVVRDGEVADPSSRDPRVQGVRRLYDAITRDTRVSATAIQTVGAKGYDGFLLAMVL
jgi:predicted O-methyltransferase YrrM